MILYCDTSALLKKYVIETGSDKIADILNEEYVITSSILTELELTSAIEIAKRMSRILSPEYQRAYRALERDFQKNAFSILDISVDITRIAKQLIKLRRLRAPDAIQLATAKTAASKFRNHSFKFCCADHELLNAARLEGLSCIDPTH